MTETVRFVDSVSYSDEVVAEVVDNFYGASFVIPTANILEVESSGVGDAKLTVATGMAVVLGALYENTAAEEFTLDA